MVHNPRQVHPRFSYSHLLDSLSQYQPGHKNIPCMNPITWQQSLCSVLCSQHSVFPLLLPYGRCMEMLSVCIVLSAVFIAAFALIIQHVLDFEWQWRGLDLDWSLYSVCFHFIHVGKCFKTSINVDMKQRPHSQAQNMLTYMSDGKWVQKPTALGPNMFVSFYDPWEPWANRVYSQMPCYLPTPH